MFFNTIQGLRAYAALSVVVYHLLVVYGLPAAGAFGVDIFFVISGFIMAHIASHAPEQFFLRRLVRVIPLYWLCTLGVFAIALIFPALLNSTTADPVSLLKSLAFVPYEKENGLVQPLLFLGWTLNYEIYFYLVFQIALVISRRYAVWICAAFISILPAINAFAPFENVILDFYANDIVFEFIYGMAAYMIWQRYKAQDVDIALRVILALVFVGLVTALPALELANEDWKIPRALLFGIPAFGVVTIAALLERTVRMPGFAVLLGNASYSLYLLHAYIIQLSEKVILPELSGYLMLDALLFTGIAAVCIAAALASYKLFERPAHLWGKRMVNALTGRASKL